MEHFKAHSHYCIFLVRLQQTVALLRRDRKLPISALTQSTAESADRCGKCDEPKAVHGSSQRTADISNVTKISPLIKLAPLTNSIRLDSEIGR